MQAERLSAALARLREQAPAAADAGPTPPAEPTPPPRPTRPWLATVFRALAAQDAPAAGRLLLALLPAQRAADPGPVAYDLILGEQACAQVTVNSTEIRVEMHDTPRAPAEVDFKLEGGPAGIARLVAARGVRRRVHVLAAVRARGRPRVGPWPRRARLWGDYRRLASLDRLIEARLTLRELDAAGVRLDPVLAMTVFGLMIDPAWTTGERFVIGHREPAAASVGACLHVRDGASLRVAGEAPHRRPEAVVICPSEQLARVLAGVAAPAELVGRQAPLALLRRWLDRAQCG